MSLNKFLNKLHDIIFNLRHREKLYYQPSALDVAMNNLKVKGKNK